MNKLFDDKFNALSVKQQYFTLKYAMKDRELADEMLQSDQFSDWIGANKSEVSKNAPEWNVQFNKFTP